MTNISRRFAEALSIDRLNLMHVEEFERQRILGLLRDLQEELVSKVVRFDPSSVTRPTFRQRRLSALLEQTEQSIKSAYTGVEKTTKTAVVETARNYQTISLGTLNGVLQAPVFSVAFTLPEARALARDVLIQGQTIKTWTKNQSVQTVQRFNQQMSLAVSQGEGLGDMIGRIRGRRTGNSLLVKGADGRTKRVTEYVGGVMNGTTRSSAEALARTAVNTSANETLSSIYQAHSDIVQGVEALVTLDLRTSDICAGLSGGAWDIESGAALPQSATDEDFPGNPPYHFNCRTIIVPILLPWNEILSGNARARLPGLDDVPESVQASMDGGVSGRFNFELWMRDQSKSRQLEWMGATKRELWLEGKINFQQLTDKTGRPRSAAELKKLFG